MRSKIVLLEWNGKEGPLTSTPTLRPYPLPAQTLSFEFSLLSHARKAVQVQEDALVIVAPLLSGSRQTGPVIPLHPKVVSAQDRVRRQWGHWASWDAFWYLIDKMRRLNPRPTLTIYW